MAVTNVKGPAAAAAARVQQPELERHLVELVRALPRHRGQFLEASRLSAPQAEQFLRQVLPAAPQQALEAGFDRLLHAMAESQHHLAHGGPILAFLARHAPQRLEALAGTVHGGVAGAPLASCCRKLRRLAQLPLPRELRAQAGALLAAGQASLRQGAPDLPVMADKLRASQLSELLHLSPLSRVKRSFEVPRSGPGGGQIAQFSFVSGPNAEPVRGIAGRSEERRGRLSKIRPLLLEDNGEMVDKVVKVEDDRGHAGERMPARIYLRQAEAMAIAASKVRPRASFYDVKGDLHDVVPRYDGDLIHLMQANDNQLAHLGLVVATCQEVLTRLNKLHAAGWGYFDLKPDNVLWNRRGDFALTDYDTAQPLGRTVEPDMYGSEGFTAPEILLGQGGPTAAADLFSLGVTLAKLLAPQELQRIPLWITEPHPSFRDEDPELRDFAQEQVGEVLADYTAYQVARGAGPAALAAIAEQAAPYEDLRAALTETSDAFVAALVVDRLLHADPAQRGTAGALLAEVSGRYPEGHPAFRENVALLQDSCQLCPYTLRMDATYRDMRSFRDGLLRGGLVPPPLPPP